MNTLPRILVAALVFYTIFQASAVAQERVVPSTRGELVFSFAPIVKRTAPAVVNVYAKQLVPQTGRALMEDEFFRRFIDPQESYGRPRERIENSLGSGVIVDGRGLIVTNNHVVKNGIDIRVALADKRELEAKLLLADERTDLAVLKVDVPDQEILPALRLADSENLEVGDMVLAIGNPFGVGQTVTSGIVSALARTQVGVMDYQFFIQTDAAINPGNSGGALVNMRGELVGINTAIFSRSGGSIGIGFSIPSNMVKTVVQSAASGQKIRRPWLGAEFQDVTQEIADGLGFVRPEGALIVKLHPQSPLLAAGIRRGDVITVIDDKIVENARELGYRVATAQIGESRLMEFHRGRRTLESTVKMVAAPEVPARDPVRITGQTPLAGLTVGNLSPALAEELRLSADTAGVAAITVKEGPATRFFREGDILAIINGDPVPDVATLRRILQNTPNFWDIEILRGNRTLRLRLGG
jgi:Do/DeqQ family serine protease